MSEIRTRRDQNNAPVTVIVGGMHGLTKSVARLFYDRGHQLIIVDKRDKSDEEREPFYHHAIQADLLDVENLPQLAEEIGNIKGRLTNFIVGLKYRGPEETEWQGEFDLGLTVPKVLIEGLLPLFDDESAILLISSTASQKVTLGVSMIYHCMKAGLDQMIRYYASHLGPKGIRVNGISPGYMVKDESIPYFMKDQEKVKDVCDRHPLKRFGRGDDIAHAAYFLCSPESSFITGQIITIDGGLSLENPGYA